jgi:hypothetical protein
MMKISKIKRRPILRIDASNVNLSSEWEFSEKNQVRIERNMEFLKLVDSKVNEMEAGSEPSQSEIEANSMWYSPVSFKGEPAVELSNQFRNELEKIRQIIDAIMQRVNNGGLRHYCAQMSAIDRVSMEASGPPSLTMVEYNYKEVSTFTHYEKESTNFFADGIVNTMDGRSIDFSFKMDLDREFFREEQFSREEKGYVMIDPLVINLDTTVPRLSEAHVSFDLDMDGENEDMQMLMPGSGLLSFDKNKDGIINDGSELFGPTTGNGFAELSEYDLDNNMWIDENDAIFDELTLWENDGSGQMQLTKIKEAGIGAIYLASAPTPFNLTDDNNNLVAKIKKSGIALNEDGSVSSIQEMDWTA